jgi:N-acetylglucosaminyldiphosphoundecaprenol N-acetyl-beta-D-mannosaminyltransferase
VSLAGKRPAQPAPGVAGAVALAPAAWPVEAARTGLHGVVRTTTLGVTVDACPDLALVVQAIGQRLRQAGSAALVVTFVNPASVAMAGRHGSFRQALERFDLVLPDGIGMAIAVRRLAGLPAARISFDSTSLALPVMRLAEERRHGIALVGGRAEVALHAAAEMRRNFPGLGRVHTWHGYGDVEATIRAILAAAPAIVICGMGAGAQEEFLLRLVAAGWRGVGFTCGGYLDQLAGGLHYYPPWVDRANLRWAYRLAREPGRLWRRYLFDYGHFAGRFLLASMARGRRPGATP